jgi:hypothetical protein
VQAWRAWQRRLGLWASSVRLRLTVWSLILLGAVLLAFSFFVYIRQERDVQANTIAQLQDLSAQTAGLFKNNHELFKQNGMAGVLTELTQSQIKPNSELAMALLDPQGHVIQRSRLLQPGDGAGLEKAWLSVLSNPKNLTIDLSITPLGASSPRE